jgi:hypothetical protein
MNLPLPKRCRIVWVIQGRVLAEGETFTPKRPDYGHEITVEVRDRIREQAIAQCQLSPVARRAPEIQNVRVVVESSQPFVAASVQASFIGGVEGSSVITWFVGRTPTSGKVIETSARKWIDVAPHFAGRFLWCTYLPVNDCNEQGAPATAAPITLPRLPTADSIIKKCLIELNPEYTELHCLATAEGSIPLRFTWAYRVGDGHTAIGTQDRVHVITARDIDQDVCCVVEARKEGSRPVQTVAYMEPPLADRIRPRIAAATIRTVADRSNKRVVDPPPVLGHELEVVYDYVGPPLSRVSIVWERENNKTWQTLFKGDRYIPSGSDLHQSLRVVVIAIGRIAAIAEDLQSSPYESKPVVIQPSPLFERLASTLKRSGKTNFAATLITGESVVVCLEGQDAKAQFVLRSGDTVLHKSDLSRISVNLLESSPNGVTVNAGYGYHTQLSIERKRLPSGADFPPGQARDLFLETIRQFARTVKKSPAARKRA